MHTIRSLLSKIEKIESDIADKGTIYCWINAGDDHDEKVAAMKARHPDKEIFSIGWLQS